MKQKLVHMFKMLKKCCVFGLILLLLFTICVQCYDERMTDIQSSVFSLEQLLKDELELKEDLDNYIDTLDFSAKQVREYLDDLYASFDPGDDLEAYVSNPLNAFALVKRTSVDFINRLLPILDNHDLSDLQAKLSNDSNSKFPTFQDYYESCISMALIQETYGLNITDLCNGVIRIVDNDGNLRTFQSKSKLTCETTHQIGIIASNRGWHDSAHLWLKNAIEECSSMSPNVWKDIKEAYETNIEVHDFILQSRGRSKGRKSIGRTFTIPISQKSRRKKKYQKILPKNGYDIDLNEFRSKNYAPLFQSNGTILGPTVVKLQARDNFHSLCKEGETSWRSPDINSNLTCRYHHHLNPYLKLGPFLIEEKNFYPAVVLFHDVLSGKEIAHFKKAGNKGMQRSRIVTTSNTKAKSDGIGGKTSLTRTSQQGWIIDRDYRFPVTENYKGWDNRGLFHTTEEITDQTCPHYPSSVQDYLVLNDLVVYNVTKRIELGTGLVLDRPYASESYQVVNYGLGGQYDIHTDIGGYHTDPGEKSNISDKFKLWYSLIGVRHSTFMLYLSTVEAGGGTAFPLLGLRANPVAGDAVFWNNIYSDGNADYLSFHGGCPSVVGSKWVTNKWILHYDNFKAAPCGLKELQSLETINTWRKTTLS